MTQEELDRLTEILFYLYFSNRDTKVLKSSLYWENIKTICVLYNINERAVVQAVRILMAPENVPEDKETYYLLNKAGLTVRPIRHISGIYWQKQKQYAEEFNVQIPTIKHRLVDVIYKQSIKDFLAAIYDISGIFNEIPKSVLFK